MTNQTKNNNLNYLIDPTFTKVNRLFVLSFENGNDRTSFSEYYVQRMFESLAGCLTELCAFDFY